ncbi:MAG TPA: hypothetical protein VMS37_24890 [Verrucomicrobiae bacterium]|nr:hypothetical protein [Verrucomicrobiae bacterium]
MESRYDWEVRPADEVLLADEEYKPFPNRDWTLAWLRGFRTDRRRMAGFRDLAVRAGYLFAHSRPDDALLNALASEIAWGRFRLVRAIPKLLPLSIAPGEEPQAVWASPRPSAARPQPFIEEQTFSPDLDTLAIAEAQKEAARAGVPFCEECARAAAAAKTLT